MINQYKRQDIFLCRHDAHRTRGQRVSVYHVMHRKKCYPEGCVYFLAKCSELAKRKTCHRGYSYVGRKCPGCKYYDEEKMTRTLSIATDVDIHAELEAIYEFEEWLRDTAGKEWSCQAKIRSVKPRMIQTVYPSAGRGKEHTHLLGYLICFEYCYIGQTFLQDTSYAITGRDFQKRHRFTAGDEIEFRATLTEQDGRLVFQTLRQIEFRKKSSMNPVWTDSLSLVAKHTGSLLGRQADKCIPCPYGFLIDVHEYQNGGEILYHRIFCLQGMKSAAGCVFELSKEVYGNLCPNRHTNYR